MAKGLKSYREWLGTKLSNPERAAKYLNAAADDSEAMFLKALRKVATAQSRSMADIADACGLSRESLYRMLSENGNPTSENRRSILAALGFKSVVVVIPKAAPERHLQTESANNTVSSYSEGTIPGNSSSGNMNQAPTSIQFVRSRTPAIPVQVGVMSERGNFNSVGYWEGRTEQTGASH